MFTVELCLDRYIDARNKRRDGSILETLFTATNVNIGNFSNLNLFCDNSVELNCGKLLPPMSAYQLATDANIIKVMFNGWTVIGQITDWTYINDNNVNISYVVDSLMSALASNGKTDITSDCYGYCERVHHNSAGPFVNLQPEDFTPSDVSIPNTLVTSTLNAVIQSFENLTPGNAGIDLGNANYVLTVSPKIVHYVGAAAWAMNPSVSGGLKTVGNFNFNGADSTSHAGGIFRGTPYRFFTSSGLKTFINNILNGCGFKTNLGANGYDSQDAVNRLQYVVNDNKGGGQVHWENRNTGGYPMEAITFIDNTDLYNVYVLPNDFCTNIVGYRDVTAVLFQGFKQLANLHKFSQETNINDRKKLIAYPYYYNRIETINGDKVDIIPQIHWTFDPSGNPNVTIDLRFIGGDSPRLMGRIRANKNIGDNPYQLQSCNDWFTIRNYPCLMLSVNTVNNPHIQRDIANNRKISTIKANVQSNSAISSPLRQGYLDGVRGTNTSQNTNKGMIAALESLIGKGAGKIHAGYNWLVGDNGASYLSDTNAQTVDTQAREIQTANMITSDILYNSGNDYMSQFGLPATSVYDCGATDAELFTFCRYLDEFGSKFNSYLNPLTNNGNLFEGNTEIVKYNGLTFYKFARITPLGYMPIEWKKKIAELFESGVNIWGD